MGECPKGGEKIRVRSTPSEAPKKESRDTTNHRTEQLEQFGKELVMSKTVIVTLKARETFTKTIDIAVRVPNGISTQKIE